jgi:hypothetical protein
MNAPDKPATVSGPVKITQGRSPAYPYISLGKAVERLQTVVDAGVGRNAYPPETFYKLWDIGSQSSGARGTMAALNHFGLVDYDGRGEVRKVKVSDLGLKIALDKVPGSPERAQALQLAALTPGIHSDLYQRYQHMLPADVVLATYLTRDRGYNASAVDALIDEYKDTLAFAGLDKPEAKNDSVASDPLDPLPPAPVKVGDIVQIEINGAFQLKEPKPIEEIQEYEGEKWVFVKGEKTAVKMEQVILQSAPAKLPPTRSLPAAENEITLPPQNVPDVRMVGDRLIIAADVDLKGLRKLRKQLRMFESMLKMGDDEEADDENDD